MNGNSRIGLCFLNFVPFDVVLGILPISADQQEALRRSLFHESRRSRQDGLQGHRNRQEGQRAHCGQPHQQLSAKNPHQQVTIRLIIVKIILINR